MAWGLGVSALLHLLLLLFAARTWIPVRPHGGGGEPAARQVSPALPEMRAYRIQIGADTEPEATIETPELPDDERPIQRRTPTPVEPATPVAERPEGAAGGVERERDAAPSRSPAERLRPGLVDPRLWERAGAPPEPEKSELDMARERVYARIEALNDSLAAEGELARRATDWTFTDKDGKKWGVSSGHPPKAHLGGVTLPLPFGFSAPPDQAKEARDRAAKAGEISDHAGRARTRGVIQDQIRATREQRDRDRAAKKDSTNTGGRE
jgi:hypothetical protein